MSKAIESLSPQLLSLDLGSISTTSMTPFVSRSHVSVGGLTFLITLDFMGNAERNTNCV